VLINYLRADSLDREIRKARDQSGAFLSIGSFPTGSFRIWNTKLSILD